MLGSPEAYFSNYVRIRVGIIGVVGSPTLKSTYDSLRLIEADQPNQPEVKRAEQASAVTYRLSKS